MTSTYVLLPVSAETYSEIEGLLREASYHHCFQDDGSIILFNIAIEPTSESVRKNRNRDTIIQSLQTP